MKLYPLKFETIFQPKIWGGNKICQFKEVEPTGDSIGESWEISSVVGNISLVANGFLKGQSLTDIINTYKEKLVGERNYKEFGSTLPLLFKFIDASSDLSVQVHPNNLIAQKKHDSLGKTELWYVIDATSDAFLLSGFKEELTPEFYEKSVADNTIVDYLDRHVIEKGDVFFLPAGRVHAIGAGSFIAEIQQTSDITYRIYDYDRRDAQGNPRELHTDEAKKVLDFSVYDDHRTEYARQVNTLVELGTCEYFTTNLLELTKPFTRDLSSIDSFVVYMCTKGNCVLADDKGNDIELTKGETVLLAAETKNVSIKPKEDTTLLESYV